MWARENCEFPSLHGVGRPAHCSHEGSRPSAAPCECAENASLWTRAAAAKVVRSFYHCDGEA
jgi:hypothetical protein